MSGNLRDGMQVVGKTFIGFILAQVREHETCYYIKTAKINSFELIAYLYGERFRFM